MFAARITVPIFAAAARLHGGQMKVEITTPPGIFAEGILERILSQQGAPYPHIVIEMKVTGSNHPVKVMLDTLDLSTIARLAKGSGIRQIQDAIR